MTAVALRACNVCSKELVFPDQRVAVQFIDDANDKWQYVCVACLSFDYRAYVTRGLHDIDKDASRATWLRLKASYREGQRRERSMIGQCECGSNLHGECEECPT